MKRWIGIWFLVSICCATYARTYSDSAVYQGIQIKFVRLGMDLNTMKKNQNLPHALLVGLRIATAYQQYDLTQVKMNDTFWGEMPYKDFTQQTRCDAWGEVVAGCHVNIASGLMMGWYIRLKLLITRTEKNNGPMPYYIPGFGYRDDTNWGLNYYIGWKF